MADAGVMRGVVLRASGSLLGRPWKLLGSSGEPLGVILGAFGSSFGAPRPGRERKGRKSENHGFPEGIHRFLRSQELQNEVKMRLKRLRGQ